MIFEYAGWLSATVFGITGLVYLLNILSLDESSIRREFFQTIFALLIFIGASVLAVAVRPGSRDSLIVFEILPWAPLVTALLAVITLPTLAKSWTTTGRNPRKRPDYEPTLMFRTVGDELRVMRLIVRMERDAVKGSKSARARLKSLRYVRRFFTSRDPFTMNVIRRDIAKDKVRWVNAMQAIDP